MEYSIEYPRRIDYDWKEGLPTRFVWVTQDGSRFESERDAIKHQKKHSQKSNP